MKNLKEIISVIISLTAFLTLMAALILPAFSQPNDFWGETDPWSVHLNGDNQAEWTPNATVIPNLNAGLLDGHHWADIPTPVPTSNDLKLDGTNWSSWTPIPTVKPYLNSDLHDDLHVGTSGAAVPNLAGHNTFGGKQTFDSVATPYAVNFPDNRKLAFGNGGHGGGLSYDMALWTDGSNTAMHLESPAVAFCPNPALVFSTLDTGTGLQLPLITSNYPAGGLCSLLAGYFAFRHGLYLVPATNTEAEIYLFAKNFPTTQHRGTLYYDSAADEFIIQTDDAAVAYNIPLNIRPVGDLKLQSQSGDIHVLNDSQNVYFGAGKDALIKYTGTNWLFDIAQATTAIVFNESSFDTDFRIESDGNVNMFFLDAGNNRIGIANGAPGYALDVTGMINTAGTTNNTYRWNAASATPTPSTIVLPTSVWGGSTLLLGAPTGCAKVNIAGVDRCIPYY